MAEVKVGSEGSKILEKVKNAAILFAETETARSKLVKYVDENKEGQKLILKMMELLESKKSEIHDLNGYFGVIRLIGADNEDMKDRFMKSQSLPLAIRKYFSTLLLKKFLDFASETDESDSFEVKIQKRQLRQYLAKVGKSLITYVPHEMAMQYVRTLGDFKTPLFQTPYQIGEDKPTHVTELVNKLQKLSRLSKNDTEKALKELSAIAGFDTSKSVSSEIFGDNPTEYAWILVILRGMFAFNDGNKPEVDKPAKNVPRDSCEYINALNASEGFDLALSQERKTNNWESYCDEVMPVCTVRPGKLYTAAGYRKMLRKNNRSETNVDEIVRRDRPVKKPAKCALMKGHEGHDAQILMLLRQIHRELMNSSVYERKYLEILIYEFKHRKKFDKEGNKRIGLEAFRRAKTDYDDIDKIEPLIDKAFTEKLKFMRGGKTANYLKLTGNPMSRLDLLEDFAKSRQKLLKAPASAPTASPPAASAPAAESTNAETVAAAIVKIIVEPRFKIKTDPAAAFAAAPAAAPAAAAPAAAVSDAVSDAVPDAAPTAAPTATDAVTEPPGVRVENMDVNE